MKWKKFTVETTTEAEELVGALLLELGIDSYEIEDKVPLSEEDKKRMFIDILPDYGVDDGVAYLSFYCPEETDTEEVLEKLAQGFAELAAYSNPGTGRVMVSETEDSDWVNNWKEFFKPFRVDDTVVIKPTWEEWTEQREGDLVLELDPGTAFGTGAHETTKLCIGGLKRFLEPDSRVLDLGCGSGILSILSRKLGASFVVGTDIDENAVKVSGENCIVNGVEAEVLLEGSTGGRCDRVWQAAGRGCGFFCCDVLQDEAAVRALEGEFDIVVANILADVIIPLSAVVGRFLKRGGYFISSGIIDMKSEEVKEALLQNGWSIMEENHMGDWVSFVAMKGMGSVKNTFHLG